MVNEPGATEDIFESSEISYANQSADMINYYESSIEECINDDFVKSIDASLNGKLFL